MGSMEYWINLQHCTCYHPGTFLFKVFIKHMEQSEVLIDLSIKEVVLASDFMSKIRKLTTSRSVPIHYEGQLEEDKHVIRDGN